MSREDRISELDETPERKYIDALLDISEESFMRDLQPPECHCYSGWEHAVQGWARVSPMSCIIMNQKSQDKTKHREGSNSATLVTDQTPSKAGSTASLLEQHCKSHAVLPIFQEARSPNPQGGGVHNATQKHLKGSFFEGKTWMLLERPSVPHHPSSESSTSESRASQPKQRSVRQNVTVVPIKNFTFLPPINSTQRKPQVDIHIYRGKKNPDAKHFYKLEKSIGASRTQLDIAAHFSLPISSPALTHSHQACQQKPHLPPAVCVSVPGRRQLSISTKRDTVNPTMSSLSKNMPRAMVQPRVPARCMFT